MNLPKTKIVATIGPSTWKDDVLLEMIAHGFVIARINASFADFDEIERVSTQIRKLSPRVTVMLDAMGHKVRVTGFEDDKVVKKGDEIILVSEGVTARGKNVIKITYPHCERDFKIGSNILIDDGNIQLDVTKIEGKKVYATVKNDGVIKRRKTVNVPGTHLQFPKLSKKDEGDIKYAVENNLVDLVSASFVRNVEDIELVKEAIGDHDVKVIAKIEDYEGSQNFDEILEVVDGIMVARGDLGVELPLEQIPILQKEMIYKCRQAGKPVIVATQMLESMKENPRPTRAEASDVANAVLDGTDALMLSAETSTGKFPIEAVKAMSKIAAEAERHMIPHVVEGNTRASESTDALCKHVASIIEELDIAGVIVLSHDGYTVASLSRHRLQVPIWEISNNPRLVRQNQLLRGVTGYYIQDLKKDRDQIIEQAVNVVYGNGHLDIQDNVLVLAGSTIAGKNTDSMLEVVKVKNALDI
jgi:pyruvate kinase